VLQKSRKALEIEWNEAAEKAGAKGRIRIVNELDSQEIPELPEGFQWLEDSYAKCVSILVQ